MLVDENFFWKICLKTIILLPNRQKTDRKPTKNRQFVGFANFLCRFLSVLKNRQKPTKFCRFSDTKPTSVLSVAILGYKAIEIIISLEFLHLPGLSSFQVRSARRVESYHTTRHQLFFYTFQISTFLSLRKSIPTLSAVT